MGLHTPPRGLNKPYSREISPLILMQFQITDNLLYTDTRYNEKIHSNDKKNDYHETFALNVTISHKLSKNIEFNTLKKHMF